MRNNQGKKLGEKIKSMYPKPNLYKFTFHSKSRYFSSYPKIEPGVIKKLLIFY